LQSREPADSQRELSWKIFMSGAMNCGDAGASEGTPRTTKEWSDLHSRVLAEISDAVIVIDRETRVHCWNPGAERLYGLNASEMLGRKLEASHQIRWVGEGDEQAALNSLSRTGRWRGENIHVTKDGRELCVESSASVIKGESGEAIGVLAIMRDTTERVRFETLLRESQERLELAQRVAHIGMFDWNVQDDTSVSSDQAQALHGLVPGTFHGGYQEWKRFVHPDDLEETERGVADALRTGGEHSHIHRVIWADGSVHWLQSRIKVFLDAEGTARRVIGVFVDVTDLKQAEEMARLNCQELERRVAIRTTALQENTEQMEAFVYSISHDLRAPLRSMEGFAEAILEDEGVHLRPLSRDYLRRIGRAAQRMDALVCDLVNYTRLEKIDLALLPVSLDRVLDGALFSLANSIREKHAAVTVARPLPHVLGNGATLEVVVTNLLSNALKFVAPGVRPEIRVWAQQQETTVRLWVSDNGIGIAQEYHNKVFRVFERLHGDEAYPGTGIGLAIVRKGVQRMGGRSGVQSAPGHGSSFWIELPKTAVTDEISPAEPVSHA
jgi:PAS domain S-box-containing protein